MLAELGTGLVASGYRPLLLPTERGGKVARHIDMMLHYNVAGAIVTDDASPAEIARQCADHGVPLVLINKRPVADTVLNVSMDTETAGKLAARALFDAGCRRVALASQRRSSHSIGLRRSAFWVINWLYGYFLFLCQLIVVLIIGFGNGHRVFVKHDAGLIIIFYLLFGCAMTSLSCFFSTFFNSKAIAGIVASCFVFLSGVLGAPLPSP